MRDAVDDGRRARGGRLAIRTERPRRSRAREGEENHVTTFQGESFAAVPGAAPVGAGRDDVQRRF